MKMNRVMKTVKMTAEKALRHDANCTTTLYFFQPKAPANLDRFKKNKK